MAKVPIVHQILYGEIRKTANGKVIRISEIRPILSWRIRIPMKYHLEIVEELCYYGLLKKLNRDEYLIKECVLKNGYYYQNDFYIGKPPTDSLGAPFW